MSEEERRILQPLLGFSMIFTILFHLGSYAAVTWFEHYNDYSPLYYLTVAFTITCSLAAAVCWIKIVKRIEKKV